MNNVIQSIRFLAAIGWIMSVSTSLCAQEYAQTKIDIGVVVSDLDVAMDFYQNVLGMKKTGLYDLDADFGKRSGLTGGVPVKIEVLKIEDSPSATEFKLMSFTNTSAHAKQNKIQDDAGMQYITVFVKSLAPWVEKLESKKVPFLGDTPIPIDDSVSFLLIQDPDGNFIEIIGPPN